MEPITGRRTSKFPAIVSSILAAAGLGLACGSAVAAAAGRVAAPGRVVFPVNGGVVSPNVDGGMASLAVGLPGGGAVLLGSGAPGQGALAVARLTPTGALDQTFGTAGIVTIPLPSPLAPSQLLRQPDGKLLLIASGTPRNKYAFRPETVVRLNADGTLDPSFGSGGIATAPVDTTAYRGTAALAPDGGVVLVGSIGQLSTAIEHDPNAGGSFKWVVTRLTPAGLVDQTFGQAGLATIPTGAAADVRGDALALLADGSIAALGEVIQPAGAQPISMLTRLTPAGAPDPAFNGGVPTALAGAARGTVLLAQPDGSVVVGAVDAFLRYTQAGAPDPSFGTGGLSRVGTLPDPLQLFPQAGGAVLATGPSRTVPAAITGLRVTSTGAVDPSLGGGPPGATFQPAFGGGGSSFLVSVRPRPLPPLTQDRFFPGEVARRADGSFLLVGGLDITQPTGEGDGYSIFDFAAAAFTPSFAPVAAFGGPAAALSLTASVPRQRAATAHTRHGIRVTLNASTPGLARVFVRAGSRLIAQSVLPIFGSGARTLPVELTHAGAVYLRTHRSVRVTVSATARDLLTGTATVRATGTLK